MLNEENAIDAKALAAIGPERLATLLAEVVMVRPCMLRRLQFELTVQKGENVVAAVREWITDFSEQTSFLDAEQLSELAGELDAIRLAIVSHVARVAPDLAPDFMWQFFELAGTVFERTAEEGWEISCIFDEACADLVKVTVYAGTEPTVFAGKVLVAIKSSGYGEYKALVRAIAAAEPRAPVYVSQLKMLLQQSLDEQPRPKDGKNSSRDLDLQYALRELDTRSGG